MGRAQALIAWGGPALLVVAALVPDLRPPIALALGAGWATLRAAQASAAIAWAACLPVAVLLTWPWILGADTPVGPEACVDPFSLIALRRVATAVVVLALVAALARAHAGSADELGLRRPTRREGVLAIGAAVTLAIGGLVVGPAIARPFFGDLLFETPAAALLPAVLFGVANGVMEEVAYRGALQGWLARVAPVPVAIATQALVFGIVHAGPEVVALLPVHVLLLTTAGAVGGVVAARTRSLALPIGIHVGADIALYVGLACRAPA